MINKPYDWLDFRVQQAFIFFWKWVEVLVLKNQQKIKIVYLSGLLLVISYYMLYFKLMLSGCWSWLLYCGDPDCLICCGHTWHDFVMILFSNLNSRGWTKKIFDCTPWNGCLNATAYKKKLKFRTISVKNNLCRRLVELLYFVYSRNQNILLIFLFISLRNLLILDMAH